MADRYWVGGTGTWDASSTTNWTISSGGSAGASAPTSADNVFFDNNSNVGTGSFTVTVNAGVCNDFTVSGLDGAMTLNPSTNTAIIYGNFSIPATNFSLPASGVGLRFAATASKTITTNGVTLDCPIEFNGVAGTWVLQDNMTVGATRTTTLTNGTLDLNGKTLSTGLFASSNTNTRSITSTTAATISLTVTTANTVWNTATITGLTGSNNVTVSITGNNAVTKTISAGALTEANSFNFTVGGNGTTITFTASNTVNDLTITNTTCTISNIAISIYGNLNIQGASPTLTAGTNTWTFLSTGTGNTITTNGETLNFPVTFNGAGGSWILQDNMTVGSSRTTTLTAGTLDLNGKTYSTGLFVGSGNTTRAIAFGIGNITLTGNGNTIWEFNIPNNLTFTGSGTVNATYSGGTGARAFNSRSSSISINVTAGTDQIVLGDGSFSYNNIDFTGFSGTLAARISTVTIFGNLTLSTGMTVAASTGAYVFGGTTTGKTITTNGKTLDFPVTFDGSGGSWILQDAMTVGSTRTTTLTRGTLNLNGKTLTTGLFASSNSNTRTIAFGASTGNIAVVSTGTVWTTATATNLSVTGTPIVNVNNNSATATTVDSGILSEANSISFNFTVGTYSLTFLGTASYTARNIDFTGFSGTWAATSTGTIYGNLTLSTGMTLTASTSIMTFGSTSGTKTITSNGKTLDFPVTFNGAGGTWQLVDNMTVGSTRTTTLTNGTLNLNGLIFDAGASFTTAAGTKNITFNGGTLTCPAASATAFNNAAPTNFTTTAGTGTGKISLSAATAKTFVGGGSTYNCTLENAGAGALTITGSNTFNDISNSVQPTTFTFTSGTTQTVSAFSVSGTSGNIVTLNSSTPGSAASLSDAAGLIDVSFCSIKDITATGSATWQALLTNGNTDDGGNTGWIFVLLFSFSNVTFGTGITISLA